ncbi:MAG: FecR domain-containing protein [Pseudomonadota bacterium]
MNERDDATSLEAQAFDLLDAARESGTDKHDAALTEFAARSPAHAHALDQATRLALASRALSERAQGADPSLALRLDLVRIRLGEQPLAVSAAAIVTLALAVGLLFPNFRSPAEPVAAAPIEVPAAPPRIYTSPRRGQRQVELEDGSQVWLGWNSRLETRLDVGRREVTLARGIAAFDVTHDPARPFIVNALGTQTTVTGTEFVVDAQQRDHVEVAVLEGSVNVLSTDAQAVDLEAGDAVSTREGAFRPVTRRAADEVTAWREGMLIFRQRPIHNALSTLEPYLDRDLDLREIADHPGRITGVFFVEQADEALITILEAHRIEANFTAGGQIRLRRASR